MNSPLINLKLLRHRQQILSCILREKMKHMRSDVDGVIDENYNYFFYIVYFSFQHKKRQIY